MKAVGVRPTRGDFALPDARIIKPGDPYASTLYFRMAKFGRDRMPHIGSERPDEAGLKLIEQWIAGLMGGAVRKDRATRTADRPARRWPARSRRCGWRRRLGRGELDTAERDAVLAAAAKLPAGPIRDLFEGYLPIGRAEGAEARLEPPAQGRPRPRRRRRPGRDAVLVAAGPVRQLPPDRRPGHAGRAGPVDHRQAPLARGPAGQPPGAVAADRAEVRHLSSPRRPTAVR